MHPSSGWCEVGFTISIYVSLVDLPFLRTLSTYYDEVFEQEACELMKHYPQSLRSVRLLLVPASDSLTRFNRTNYKDALKYGFYELQSARDL